MNQVTVGHLVHKKFNKKNKINMLTKAIFFYISHGSIYEEFFGWKTNQAKPITYFENTNSQYWPLTYFEKLSADRNKIFTFAKAQMSQRH